jgi:hypothetical protein
MFTSFGPVHGELLAVRSHYLPEAFPRGTLGRALLDGSAVAVEAFEKLVKKLHDEFSQNLAMALQETL